jgi:hypothetical protein
MLFRPSFPNKLQKPTLMAVSIVFILTLVLAACAPVTPAGSDSPGTEPEEVEPSPSTPLGDPAVPTPTMPPRDLPPGRELAPGAGTPQIPETPIIGEVPEDLLAEMYAYMQDDMGLDPAQFTLVRAESVIWPDGSLGCPQPGMMYTMALVEGYWVQVMVGEELVDFRASQNGGFQLCEQSEFLPSLRP